MKRENLEWMVLIGEVIKWLIRLVALPFIFMLSLIVALRQVFLNTLNFFLHGGEFVTYTKKMNGKVLIDELKKINETRK